MNFRSFVALLCLFAFSFNVHASVVANPNPSFERNENFKKRLMRNAFLPEVEPTEVHVQFANSQEAVNWAEKVLPHLKMASAAKKFDLVPTSDSRYPILQSYIHELWGAFTELYPEQTAGLNEPPIILIDSEVVNAFVPTYILEDNKIAHTVVVLTGLIDSVGGIDKEDSYTGVFAHELTHSVFRHAVSPYKERINKFYHLNPKTEILGFQAPRATEVDKAMQQWIDGSELSGDLTAKELSDLPSRGIGSPIFLSIWIQMLTESVTTNSQECTSAANAFNAWLPLQRYSSFENQIFIAPMDIPTVNADGTVLIEKQAACFGKKKVSFVALFSAVTGIPVAILEQNPEVIEMIKAFDSGANAIEGLQKVTALSRAPMAAVEAKVDFGSIGNFSREEHADDTSLIIHRYLGKNPTALAGFFKQLMPAADYEKCESYIKASALVPPGAFSDEHRASCYRIDHLNRLNAYIDTLKMDIKDFATEYASQATGQ